jgi:hypothetical protein
LRGTPSKNKRLRFFFICEREVSETRIRTRASPCGIYGGQMALVRVFPRVFRFSHQYHSAEAPWPYFIRLPRTVHLLDSIHGREIKQKKFLADQG